MFRSTRRSAARVARSPVAATITTSLGRTLLMMRVSSIAGNLRKRFGAMEETRIMSSVLPSEVVIVAATGDRATRAADLRVDRNIAYADAFALELAMDSANHVLVTADYGFKSVADLVQIEFLPAK